MKWIDERLYSVALTCFRGIRELISTELLVPDLRPEARLALGLLMGLAETLAMLPLEDLDFLKQHMLIMKMKRANAPTPGATT
jgi:hypothetical protein